MARFIDLQTAFQTRVRASQAAVRKQAQWRVRGERYLRRHPNVPRGSVVQVDPGLQARVLGLVEEAAPAVAEAYNQHFEPIAIHAFENWPVKTGLSKSLLSLEYSIESDGETFTGTIASRAPYSMFINRGATVRDLVWNPGEEAADMMGQQILDLLA